MSLIDLTKAATAAVDEADKTVVPQVEPIIQNAITMLIAGFKEALATQLPIGLKDALVGRTITIKID